MPGVHLQKRDRKVLEHVARYRLTTREVLRRLFFTTDDAAKAVLKRLSAPHQPGRADKPVTEKHFLQARPLGVGKRVYHQLTPRGARELGLPPNRAEPLGPQALPEAYAISSFCCLANAAERPVLTRTEWAASPPLASIPYAPCYLEPLPDGQRSRLVQLIIDYRTEFPRLIQKCRKVLRVGEDTPALARLIEQKVFALAILTLQNEKQAAIENELARNPLPVSVAVHVIPLLSELIEVPRDA